MRQTHTEPIKPQRRKLCSNRALYALSIFTVFPLGCAPADAPGADDEVEQVSAEQSPLVEQISAHQGACTLLHHGKVFTANPQQRWAEALLVCGSRIVAIGSDRLLTPLRPFVRRSINLGGRTVVPGINDAHVHVLTVPGTRLNTPDFVPGAGPTMAEVVDLVAAGAAANPPNTWLYVTVGESVLGDPNANRLQLDPVSPNHPVILRSWAGHGTYLNSKAMAVLGISETEPDPFGGRYDRFPGTNIVNGGVHEYAEHTLSRKLFATQTDGELRAAYEAFTRDAVRVGYTSIQDMALGLSRERSIRVLAGADLALRVRSICFPLSVDESCAESPHFDPKNRLDVTGFKWITDGSPIERGAFLNAPYSDQPDTSGFFNFEQGALHTMMSRGLKGSPIKNQALFHAVGDGAVDNVLASAAATGGPAAWNGRRFRLEHGDFVHPNHYQALRDLGAVVVQNPIHFGVRDLMISRAGPERAGESQVLKSLYDQGISVALGTDSIGAVESPWLDIFLAVMHPTHPEEAITLEQAITAYTRGSAYAEFKEWEKGTLAVGMVADLAVLSQDVFTVPVFDLPATQSVLTMVGGDIVWNDGTL